MSWLWWFPPAGELNDLVLAAAYTSGVDRVLRSVVLRL